MVASEDRVIIQNIYRTRISRLLKLDDDAMNVFLHGMERQLGMYKYGIEYDSKYNDRLNLKYYTKLSKLIHGLLSQLKKLPEGDEMHIYQKGNEINIISAIEALDRLTDRRCLDLKGELKSGRPLDHNGILLILNLQAEYEKATGRRGGYSKGSIFPKIVGIAYEILGEPHSNMTTKLEKLLSSKSPLHPSKF